MKPQPSSRRSTAFRSNAESRSVTATRDAVVRAAGVVRPKAQGDRRRVQNEVHPDHGEDDRREPDGDRLGDPIRQKQTQQVGVDDERDEEKRQRSRDGPAQHRTQIDAVLEAPVGIAGEDADELDGVSVSTERQEAGHRLPREERRETRDQRQPHHRDAEQKQVGVEVQRAGEQRLRGGQEGDRADGGKDDGDSKAVVLDEFLELPLDAPPDRQLDASHTGSPTGRPA
jgi:hypothetical protein